MKVGNVIRFRLGTTIMRGTIESIENDKYQVRVHYKDVPWIESKNDTSDRLIVISRNQIVKSQDWQWIK